MRLVARGKTREDLWRLLMINTRTPHLLDGDLRAMLGSTRIGAEHIGRMFERIGMADGRAYLAGVLDHAERRMRAVIAAVPDGVYRGEAWSDNDCFTAMDIPIRVTVTIAGDGMTVDFSGTGEQMRGFKNSSLANTHSAVYTAVTSFFDPSVPRNSGTFRAITIVAPEGSLVNPRPPAATTMCTVFPASEIIHAIWQALGQALPESSCAGWGLNAFPNSSGTKTNGELFVMYHWAGTSGGGAVKGRDGFPQQGGLITLCGLVIPNVESFEQLYPVRILRQELRCDAGGAGMYRGGPGVHYEVDIHRPVQFSFRGEGFSKFPAYGTVGGRPGAGGEMTVRTADGASFTPPPYGIRHVGPARLTMATPAGGGWGDPLEREPGLVLRDVSDGVVTREAAESVYGVVLDAAGRRVDAESTRARREELRAVSVE
jgi:N-methylhydantoinase B